jgi:hypothetical protein
MASRTVTIYYTQVYRGDINHDKTYKYQQASACTKEKGTKEWYIKT